jgi:cation diffusion facilitator family transporter
MFDSITDRFVPNTRESARTYRSKIGIFQGIVSVCINGLLFILKLTIGLMVGAVSVIADAVHSLSDVVSSAVVIWGFKQAEKPADVEHPYGHGRAEYIATLIIAVLLVVAGIEFFQMSIDRIRNPEVVTSQWWMVVVLIFTIVLKEITARFAEHLSSKIASGTLHADAWHHRTDAISSLLVVAALIAGNYGYPAVDGWAGLGVSLFLIYTGYEIAKDAVDDLIGKPPTTEEIEQIRQIVKGVVGVLGAHDIVVHSYGHDKFVSVHIEIDADKTTAEAHDVSERVEETLKESIGAEPTVHLDPVHPNNPMVQQVGKTLSKLISNDNRITDIHDIRVVNSDNHQIILFGINIRVGLLQRDILLCTETLKKAVQDQFSGYDVEIKVSPIYRY